MRNIHILGRHRHISSRVVHRGRPRGTLRCSTSVAVLSAVLFWTFALGAYAATPDKGRSKPAWEWSVEERLLERFDAANVLDRHFAHQKMLEQWGRRDSVVIASHNRSRSYVIDGSRNPELFLPHELFDSLMTGLNPDPSMRSLQRGFYRDAIRLFGYDDEAFWTTLERISGPYLSYFYNSKFGATPIPDAACKARYEAMEEARHFFGREQFERFLYTVMAPAKQQSTVTMEPDPAVSLRFEESGCR
jgi:hypothetical protein